MRQPGKDFLLILGVHIFQNVDRIVRIKLLNGDGEVFIWQGINDFKTNSFVNFGQSREVKLLAEQSHQSEALILIECFDQVGKFCFMKFCDFALQGQRITVGNCRADMRKVAGTHDAVGVIEQRSRRRRRSSKSEWC